MSAIIPINNKYCIKLDNYSWMVCHWRPKNKLPKGGAWEGMSWHNSLQHAGESLVKRLVSESNLEGIDEILNALSVSTQTISNAIIESGMSNSMFNKNYIG